MILITKTAMINLEQQKSEIVLLIRYKIPNRL